MTIVWLPKAVQNLEAIHRYVAAESGPQRANRLIQRIVASAESLERFPYLGRQSESAPDIRELQVARLPYLLPYRIVGDRIEILRVFHEAQDRPDQWS